jgi:hypothetical protein
VRHVQLAAVTALAVRGGVGEVLLEQRGEADERRLRQDRLAKQDVTVALELRDLVAGKAAHERQLLQNVS